MALIIVIGPPAAGKTTWVLAHARPGDITIDYDRLANALTAETASTHEHEGPVRAVTFKAREAAITEAMRHARVVNVYVSMPTPSTLRGYTMRGAHLHVVDPGRAVVEARCSKERPAQMRAVVARWYTELAPAIAPLLGSGTPSPMPPPSRMVSRASRW